jgi:hypothetical protein
MPPGAGETGCSPPASCDALYDITPLQGCVLLRAADGWHVCLAPASSNDSCLVIERAACTPAGDRGRPDLRFFIGHGEASRTEEPQLVDRMARWLVDALGGALRYILPESEGETVESLAGAVRLPVAAVRPLLVEALFARQAVGTQGLGAETIVADALQALGEIVADRASQRAFQLIRDKLLGWLKCSAQGTMPDDGGDDAAGALARIFERGETTGPDGQPVPELVAELRLPHTCEMIARIRLEDIASAPAALADALLADLIAFGGAALEQVVPDLLPDEVRGPVFTLLTSVLLPTLRGDAPDLSAGAAALMASAVSDLALIGGTSQELKDVAEVAGRALGAAATCASMPACPGAGLTDIATAEPDIYLRPHVRSVAEHLWAAASLTVEGATPARADVRGRVANAADAVFELACLGLGRKTGAQDAITRPETWCDYAATLDSAEVWKKFETTQPDSRSAEDKRLFAALVLVRLRALVTVGMDRDGPRIALAVGRTISDILAFALAKPTDDDQAEDGGRDVARALRLVGAVINYAGTYTRGAGDADEDGASARREILESLVDEFTNRTGRQGDVILSLGGSLRLMAAPRLLYASSPDDNFMGWTWNGPVGLVLGFGLDWMPRDLALGVHVELGLFDLGQYLSFTDKLELREPNGAEAFSPSLTVALSGFGLQLPAFIGATIGWSPFYSLPARRASNDEELPTLPLPAFGGDRRGDRSSWYVGGVLGFYVPLFDLT